MKLRSCLFMGAIVSNAQAISRGRASCYSARTFKHFSSLGSALRARRHPPQEHRCNADFSGHADVLALILFVVAALVAGGRKTALTKQLVINMADRLGLYLRAHTIPAKATKGVLGQPARKPAGGRAHLLPDGCKTSWSDGAVFQRKSGTVFCDGD